MTIKPIPRDILLEISQDAKRYYFGVKDIGRECRKESSRIMYSLSNAENTVTTLRLDNGGHASVRPVYSQVENGIVNMDESRRRLNELLGSRLDILKITRALFFDGDHCLCRNGYAAIKYIYIYACPVGEISQKLNCTKATIYKYCDKGFDIAQKRASAILYPTFGK